MFAVGDIADDLPLDPEWQGFWLQRHSAEDMALAKEVGHRCIITRLTTTTSGTRVLLMDPSVLGAFRPGEVGRLKDMPLPPGPYRSLVDLAAVMNSCAIRIGDALARLPPR